MLTEQPEITPLGTPHQYLKTRKQKNGRNGGMSSLRHDLKKNKTILTNHTERYDKLFQGKEHDYTYNQLQNNRTCPFTAGIKCHRI